MLGWLLESCGLFLQGEKENAEAGSSALLESQIINTDFYDSEMGSINNSSINMNNEKSVIHS